MIKRIFFKYFKYFSILIFDLTSELNVKCKSQAMIWQILNPRFATLNPDSRISANSSYFSSFYRQNIDFQTITDFLENESKI